MNRLAVVNKLSGLEKIKNIYMTTEAFSVENGLLTPTFKLKRQQAAKQFKAEFDVMYSV